MSSTVICRLCLNTERRTYFINHTVLQETWERLTDAKFDTNDGRPLLACYICCAQLRNSHQLRNRALKAEKLFTKYIPDNGFEDSKKLVSLIVSKSNNIDYNYAIEEQCNLECEQKIPETVEEVKKEIEDEEDINTKEKGGKVFSYLDESVAVKEENLEFDEIAIKEEIDDVIEDYSADSDMNDVNTAILPDDGEPLTNMSLEETTQSDVRVVLESIDSGETDEECSPEDLQQTAKHIELEETIMEREPLNIAFINPPKEISITFDANISHNVHDAADNNSLNSYTNDKVFTCKLCEYECFTKRSLNVHVRKQHTEAKAFVCDLCGYRTSDDDNLKKHMCVHEKKESFSCRMCKIVFFTKLELDAHLRKHTGDKPYKCDLCEYRTKIKSYLKQHITCKHKEEKDYACHICQKGFSKRTRLEVHLRKHTGEKPYKCDLCDYRTANNECLKKHVVNMHKDKKLKEIKEKNYECDICQKRFLKKGYLNNHLRIHSGDKPYKCHMCDYRSSDNGNLKQHLMFKHVKEKNYTCHICQKKFVTNSDVNRHLRVHTGEKPFKCDLCDHRTSDSSSLRQHLKFIHKKETNYSCLICHKKCLSKRQLNEHHRVHNEEKT